MKLWSGLFGSLIILAQGEQLVRPEPFFSADNTISYTYATIPKMGSSEKNSYKIKVLNVSGNEPNLLSTCVMMLYNSRGGITALYSLRFACDSNAYYVHATNWTYAVADDKTSEFSGDSLVYPLDMKVGDSLPDAWTLRVANNRELSGKFKIDFVNRYVASYDTLDTPMGKTPAFRVNTTMKYSSRYTAEHSGAHAKKDDQVISEWFAPGIGIVLTEIRDLEYGDTRIVMDSYK